MTENKSNVSAPSTINSSALTDAVIYLNKIADEFAQNRRQPTDYRPHGEEDRGGLYDFIILSDNKGPYNSHSDSDQKEIDALRRQYLKDWISKTKIASKGKNYYDNDLFVMIIL